MLPHKESIHMGTRLCYRGHIPTLGIVVLYILWQRYCKEHTIVLTPVIVSGVKVCEYQINSCRYMYVTSLLLMKLSTIFCHRNTKTMIYRYGDVCVTLTEFALCNFSLQVCVNNEGKNVSLLASIYSQHGNHSHFKVKAMLKII